MDGQDPYRPCSLPQSIQGQMSDSTPTEAFQEFVQQRTKRYKGKDGHGNEQVYLPLKELAQYWTVSRINAAFESYSSNIYIRPEVIRGHYIRVFSILVYVGMLSYIPGFHQHGLSDNKFPATSLLGFWAAMGPSHEDMARRFRSYQWLFYPVIIDRDKLDNTILPPERILPIRTEETLRRGSTSTVEAATISKVEFDPSCNSLIEQDNDDESTTAPTYILKTYHGEQHQRHYEHEIRAFTRLQTGSPVEYIVKCYATFRQAATFNLVMEYVPGGDLLQFFRTRPPPQNAEDRIDFWDSLTKLARGLHHIHQVSVEGERSARYQLVHQDIKPDNILLNQCHESKLYQFSPIISDLGHSHTRHMNGDIRDSPAIDRRGNQVYCAPESIHHSGFRRLGPNHITSDADIFSAGAVFSDAAAWVVGGQAGRYEYLRLRQEETVGIPGFANSGYECTFHDGSERLACVDKMHHHIRNSVPSDDKITTRVLEIVEKYMMTPTNRMPASQLYGKLEIEVRKARDECVSIGPVTPTGVKTPSPSDKPDNLWSPPPTAQSTSTDGYADNQHMYSEAPSCLLQTAAGISQTAFKSSVPMLLNPLRPNRQLKRPYTTPLPSDTEPLGRQEPSYNGLRSKSVMDTRLSMRDAHEYWVNKKQKQTVKLAVEKVIEELIDSFHGRDHFFFIDDTRSMEEHALEIESSFQTLAYIAKQMDSDGLELSFVSKPLDIFKRKHTTELVQIVHQHFGKYTAIEGSIETSLGILVNKIIMRRLPIRVRGIGEVSMGRKPITIFVFTDGKWGSGVRPGNQVDKPINELMKEIQRRGLTRTQVMFQFLRFGNDEDGKSHLEHLDEFGKKENCDIVDYRDINDDVRAMFLAAYTENNDQNNDSQTASGPLHLAVSPTDEHLCTQSSVT